MIRRLKINNRYILGLRRNDIKACITPEICFNPKIGDDVYIYNEKTDNRVTKIIKSIERIRLDELSKSQLMDLGYTCKEILFENIFKDFAIVDDEGFLFYLIYLEDVDKKE